MKTIKKQNMKTLKITLFLLVGLLISITSCSSNDELNEELTAETISANSNVALLMSKTATNDGSGDNIIDSANCLSIQLPVTVTVNGTTIIVDDEDGYQDIEDIIDLFDDDVDSVVISYPIIVILADYSTTTVTSDSELAALAANCPDENDDDDDIECIDFQYPITASVFDTNNVLVNTVTINNDNEMYHFIEDLDETTSVTINFPISIILADGTTQTINNVQELENAIETAEDSCDEDDDYDYDDDDCDTCSTSDLDRVFAACLQFEVDDLKRNGTDLEDNYTGYLFTFNDDGTITVMANTTTWNGTWSASGTANDIDVIININGLPDFNNTWNLHEVEQEIGEAEVELRLGDDRLSFESDC
ncbi:hypothetical protein [Nonlabens sp.]|uniref:hypothetical protein n=1 Tax=Nonlabens sp. TaxID=1888209 RepID=UPI0025D060F4|nr:hypothetical protein [Nonlabens sp.]